METPVVEIAFSEEGDEGHWTIVPVPLPDIDARLYRFIVDLQFGITVSLSRDIMGPSFAPKELRVTYGPTSATNKYENIFGCPVLFRQRKNCFVLDREWLGRSPELGNELSYVEAVRLCDQLLKNMQTRIGIAGDVREILLHNLARPLSIASVSTRLNVPVRTLKRRLQRRGTSYRQIADELRTEIAIKYLRETELSVEEIASCLGYSEPASFREAFRRWTRKTPNEFRRKEHEAAAF